MKMNSRFAPILAALALSIVPSAAGTATPPRAGRYVGSVKITKRIPSLNLTTTLKGKINGRVSLVQGNPRLSIQAVTDSLGIGRFGGEAPDFFQGLILTVDGTDDYGFFYYDPDEVTDHALASVSASSIKFTLTVRSQVVTDYDNNEVPVELTFAFAFTRAGN